MAIPGKVSTVEMTISVIVPAYNAAHYLERSLPPLIEMRRAGQILEVLVVDDCSPQTSNIETAERLGATVIRMKRNGGPGAARNLAASMARGDILWLVDADVVAHKSGAEKIAAAFRDPEVGAVFGSYDESPPAENFASSYKNLVHRYYHQRSKADSDSFWSGLGAIRKDVYLSLNGFDSRSFGRPSIEDIEFGFRMRDAGWRIRLIPDLLGTHLKEWKLAEVVRTDIFQRAAPWSFLILSGRGVSNDLNVSNAERLKAGVAGLWLASIFLSLVTLFAPAPSAAAAFLTFVVGALNRELFGFFAGSRGVGFGVAATAYHQIYYVYSAVTFVVCAFAYHFGGRKEHVVSTIGEKDARSSAVPLE